MHEVTTVEEVRRLFGSQFDEDIKNDLPGMEIGTQHKYFFNILVDFKPGDVLTVNIAQPTLTATEGSSFSGRVANFVNSNAANTTAADFSATIDWGDGTTTVGTVTGSGSTFSVSGSHIYADEGTFTVSVALTDINDDGSGQATATATATSTANIAEADALTGTGTTLAARNKCVPSMRSDSRHRQAASKIAKISRLSIALRNHAHTVIGSRGRLMPSARKSIVVTVKFSALSKAPNTKRAALPSHRLIPASGG